ncbi:MAG: ATP-binding protein, partial [Bryobacterales bacterium]|nr:ATP-binding protein [Bryobacterales bacterium]
MLKSLTMSGVGPAPEMSIEFAPRVNALTGDNGLGKSFLLDMAWRTLTQTWARGVMAMPRKDASEPTIRYLTNANSEIIDSFYRGGYSWFPSSSERTGSIVIYVGVDGNFLIWDPARLHPAGRRDDATLASEFGGIFDLSPAQVWKGKSGLDGTRYCNGLIHDWVSWQKGIDPAFTELTRVLEALSPSAAEKLSPGQPTHLDLLDETEYPTIRMAYGEDVPLVHASAGVRRIAALAYLLVWTWKGHLRASGQRGQVPASEIIFLVDEVESHLHPQWQRRVVPALLNVMSAMKLDSEVAVQLILATHSPLVLASMESFFDEDKDALFHLDLRDGAAVLEKVEWAKQGDATNWLVSESFGLKQARSLEAETAIEA